LPVAESASFSSHTPARRWPSRAEAWLLYAAAAVPVHTWAVLIFFHALPAYLLRLSLGNILVILAYGLVLALLESGAATALVALLGRVLPERAFSPYAKAQGIGLVWLAFLWLLPTHFQIAGPEQRFLGLPLSNLLTLAWLVSLGLAAVGLFAGLRHARARAWLTGIAGRFTLLAGVYLFLDWIALAVVVFRLLRGVI